MQTPVLLLIWRRPETLRLVINAMRPIAPKHLFVACDGPNPQRPGEAARVAASRALVDNEIDWPCQIERLYSNANQGCQLGVSRAITWFFDQIEEGIILEDDCVPHRDFFQYCTTLLERYRDDTRVWCISGSNFQDGRWRGDGSYYFSHYCHCWGWASWRRCWQHYDADLIRLRPLIDSGLLRTIFDDPLEQRFWRHLWQKLQTEGKPDSWAYRWAFTCFSNGGLTTLPNRNLVTNVGFGEGATHTTEPDREGTRFQSSQGLPAIQSPSFILRDAEADRYSFNHTFGGSRLRFPRSLLNIPRSFARLYRRAFPLFLEQSKGVGHR